MYRKKFLLLLSITAFMVRSGAQQQPPPFKKISDEQLVQHVDALVSQATQMGLFSGIIVVAKNGSPVYERIEGYRDWEAKLPITPATHFNIGSINKFFTDELVHQLILEKKVQLQDPVQKHFTLFGNRLDQQITIAQLMEHRSGLGDYFSSADFRQAEDPAALTLQNQLNTIRKMPLVFEPGKGSRYSNSGYIVLGAIIEAATGKSFDQNLKERILEPLQLNNTFYTQADQQRVELARPTYLHVDGRKQNWHGNGILAPSPAGSMLSTTKDLITLAEAARGGKLPSGRKYLLENQAGGTEALNAIMAILPEGISVIILANMGFIADEISDRIAALYLGHPSRPLRYPLEMELFNNYKKEGAGYFEKNLQFITQELMQKTFDVKKRRPEDERMLQFLANRFKASNRPDIALELLQLNAKLFEEKANVHFALAEAQLGAGEREAARSNYRRTLLINPSHEGAKKKLAQLE